MQYSSSSTCTKCNLEVGKKCQDNTFKLSQADMYVQVCSELMLTNYYMDSSIQPTDHVWHTLTTHHKVGLHIEIVTHC